MDKTREEFKEQVNTGDQPTLDTVIKRSGDVLT